MTLETWELALIIGCGTLALLMCAYSVYILMRRRSPPKSLTNVIVEIEGGRGMNGSTTVKRKETKPVAKRESKTVETKETKPVAKRESKAVASKPSGADHEVIAVKIQPNNYAVVAPGGGKACIGSRKDCVQTIPPHRPRQGSAPSRIGGTRASAPRAPRV
jgi:hypothetical protein